MSYLYQIFQSLWLSHLCTYHKYQTHIYILHNYKRLIYKTCYIIKHKSIYKENTHEKLLMGVLKSKYIQTWQYGWHVKVKSNAHLNNFFCKNQISDSHLGQSDHTWTDIYIIYIPYLTQHNDIIYKYTTFFYLKY